MTAEPAGRVITAALVVVPGPGDTVTFVRQERGPYAGWWLLPGGKVEFGEPVAAAARREAAEERWDRLEPHPTDMPILNDAGAAAYPGRQTVSRPVTEAITTGRSE